MIAHVGGLVLSIVSTVAAAVFCFFLGRLLVRLGGGLIWPDSVAEGPFWAGGLPLRGVDIGIFGLFAVLSVLATIAIRREKSR